MLWLFLLGAFLNIIGKPPPNIFSTTRYCVPSQLDFISAKQRISEWKQTNHDQRPDDFSYHINELVDHNQKVHIHLKRKWGISSNKAHKLCSHDGVLVNKKLAYSCKSIALGDEIQVNLAILGESVSTTKFSDDYIGRLANFTNMLLTHRGNPPLHIIYEDDHVSVIFKPAGVHTNTWVNLIKKQLFSVEDCLPLLLTPPDRARVSDPLDRPVVTHRLDARVSGCLLVAKSLSALNQLCEQFSNRIVKKMYRAIVIGPFKSLQHQQYLTAIGSSPSHQSSYLLDHPVHNQTAQTMLQVLETVPCHVYGALHDLQLEPLTGRKHQLRQHCALLGCPILGDDLYHNIGMQAGTMSVTERSEMLTAIDLAVEQNNNTQPQQQPADTILPVVRKRVGMFLMSTGIEFMHPNASYLHHRYESADKLVEKHTRLANGMTENITINLLTDEGRVSIRLSPLPKFLLALHKARKAYAYQQQAEDCFTNTNDRM